MKRRRISLRASLMRLVFYCIAPAGVLIVLLAVQNLEAKRDMVRRDSELMARRILGEVDRELAAVESGLHVLATADSLRSGNLRAFHQEATNAVRAQIIYNYIVTDRNGVQLLNTLRPFGTPLPATGSPAQLENVFLYGKTVLSDLFVGPVTRRPAIAMGVPVYGPDNQVVYSLNIGLDPETLHRLLQRQSLDSEWIVAILDQSGTIIARSHDHARYMGQKAVPALVARVAAAPFGTMDTTTLEGIAVTTSFARSATWGWSVAVGAPKAIVEREWRMMMIVLGMTGVLLLTLGLSIAYLLSRRLITTVKHLNAAAIALREGKPILMPSVEIIETEAVGEALVKASELVSEVQHRALHDALTDLPNRAMLYSFAARQLAEATRTGMPVAVIIIDLDGFKAVNDSAGHSAGDRLLQTVAQRIRAIVRASDVPARIGGDEFAVLLVDADATIACDIAGRLVNSLAQPYPPLSQRISASIGIAIAPEHGTGLEELLERADSALYLVKRGGRNGYQVALRRSSGDLAP